MKAQDEHFFQNAYNMAMRAALDAADKAVPQPMVVQQHENMLNNASPVVKHWVVNDGVCGMSWVKFRPATTPFARWLKKTGRGRTDSYSGGLLVWMSLGGTQSYERHMAAARAFALTIKTLMPDINCFADGRID